MKLKYEVTEIFQKFKLIVENIFQTKIKVFQSDWEGEYIPLQKEINTHGIVFQHPCHILAIKMVS